MVLVQPFQSARDEDAIFAGQRDQVRDGAERDEIQERAQIESARLSQSHFATALHQGVGELERQAHRA